MKPRTARSPLTWLGGLLVVYLAFPIGAFAIRLARSNNRGFNTPGLAGALWVSVASATVATTFIAIVGIPLAYTLARSRGRLSSIVGIVVQLPLALPPIMSGILLIYLVGPYTTIGRLFHGRLTGSIGGIVLAESFVSAPFLVVAARSAFASVDPALDDVAATLGRRRMARFFLVSLPGAASGITAGLLLTWLRAFGEYGATVLLSYHPYTLPVYTEVQFAGAGLPTTQAPTVLALLAAGMAIAISRLHRPRRPATPATAPDPRPPAPTEPTNVGFDLDVTIGTFRLQIAHQATSHRLAILGPSGSGKTITLRALAGLLGPQAGAVTYGNQAVSAVVTEKRHIGYVPQGFGLFPHRRVWQQVRFAPDAAAPVAAWWLATLHIDDLADRLPSELSGGQRQRVALARALGRTPQLVLLDEPFSALDAPVREELRRELRRLQRDNGLSTVLVTHDPDEAALLADEILVIADGRLLQAGTRAEVYRRPASPQVARLLGIQNLHPGVVRSAVALSAGGVDIETMNHELALGTDVLWSVRPEHVMVSDAGRYPAEVIDVADLGATTTATLRLNGGPDLRVRSLAPIDLPIGSPCHVDLDPAAISLWPTARNG